MRIPRPLTAVAALLATALAGMPALATTADAAPDPGDRSAVSRAADRYGVGESALRSRLANDPTLRLAPNGLAYFVEPPAEAGESPYVSGQSFPLNQTFLLHSKPDSNRTIYLDFNGHNVSGTLWNGPAGNNLPAGNHPAMDLAGNGPAFTDNELLQIQDIYLRVAEDYAPFDVDVTTEEPPAADIERASSGDQVFGTRALITSNSPALATICNNQCGGVAFIGVFNHHTGKDGFAETHSQLQPAWVFANGLSNDPKNIAEATSHEVGHNLGLDHDGLTNQGYYAGHDMWAPIMGVGYERPVAQWALTDYHADADLGGGPEPALQANPDDILTITQFGAGFRADEPGTSIGNAGAVPSGAAYIHNRTDVDYFSLGTCSGNVTVTASNAESSPNLDIEVQLLNAGGTSVVTNNPPSAFVSRDIASGLDAQAVGSSLPSGAYYARIDGVGRGASTTSYTDYGSIGAYTLQVSGCGGVVDPGEQPPSAPQHLRGTYLGSGRVQLRWDLPASDGGATITRFNVYADGDFIGELAGNSTLANIENVPSGQHEFGVAAVNSVGEGPRAVVVVDATDGPAPAKPGPPIIGQAKPGKSGKPLTAKIRWSEPKGETNPAITRYQVIAYRETRSGKFKALAKSEPFKANVFGAVYKVNSRDRVKFAVRAKNALGWGNWSAKSNAVRPR